MSGKISKEDIQCIYWLTNGKNGKCESINCEGGTFCCLDRDEIIVLEYMADNNKEWEIAFNANSFFISDDEGCCDRRQNMGENVTPLIRFGMELPDIEKKLSRIVKTISDYDFKLLKAIPVIQGINSTYPIEERDAVVRICLQQALGEGLIHNVFIKVLKRTFNDWAAGNTLDVSRAFISDFMHDLDSSMSDSDSKDELSGSIANAYERIDIYFSNTNRLNPLRHKYFLLYNELGKYESSDDVIAYFKEHFSSWPSMEVILFMIREILCADNPQYNDLNPFVENLLDQSLQGKLPKILQEFRDLVCGIHELEDKQIRTEISGEFSDLLDKRGGLLGEYAVKKLMQQVKAKLLLQKAS